MLDLTTLSVREAKLVQHGLKSLGFYSGTTRGLPGPLTKSAYLSYLASFETVENDTSSIPLALIKVLLGEVGVREHPKNSNTGISVRKYQEATWLDGTRWPWCAAFICWGFLKVSKNDISLPFKRPETAAAWGFEDWAEDEGLRLIKPRGTIKAGDIVMFKFSHIGLAVEDESNGYVVMVEGNTDVSGSRDGGGVYKKRRATSLIRSHIRIS